METCPLSFMVYTGAVFPTGTAPSETSEVAGGFGFMVVDLAVRPEDGAVGAGTAGGVLLLSVLPLERSCSLRSLLSATSAALISFTRDLLLLLLRLSSPPSTSDPGVTEEGSSILGSAAFAGAFFALIVSGYIVDLALFRKPFLMAGFDLDGVVL